MKRHKYLYRLIAIIILSLFLPVIFCFTFFWKKSFEEMEKSNQVYYEKLVDDFMNSFNNKLLDLKEHASKIIVESKDTKSVFWNGLEAFTEGEYWRYLAVNDMNEKYMDHGVQGCGIYYYDLDRIIMKNGTISASEYIENMLLVKDTTADIWKFFDWENYEVMKMIFSTTNTIESGNGSLLVGYCTTLGKNQDRVLIFYVIDSQRYERLNGVIYNNGINFYILDKETGQIYLTLGEDLQNHVNPDWENMERNIDGVRQKAVYMNDDSYLPLSFAVYVENDVLQNNIIAFYKDMKYVIMIVSTLLLLISFVAIYVVYRPVHRLTLDLEHYQGGEIESIRSALDDRYSKILEQEMLILDLLLNHLIYGVPISEKRVKHLGIGEEIKHYCVFVLENYVLLNGETQQITLDIERRFHARLFATDWQGEKRSIMILFMKNHNVEELENWMNEWLNHHSIGEYVLYRGKMVDELDDIRSSFLSCFEKRMGKETDLKVTKNEVKILSPQEEQQRKLKEDILSYLEIHYRDEDLSQTKVADSFQISNYTLSRMFKNQVGVGFTEYVNAKRLELAKELLLTTSYSVREISLMVGFSNDNYFSRLFKTTVGISATSFREK